MKERRMQKKVMGFQGKERENSAEGDKNKMSTSKLLVVSSFVAYK